MKIKIYINTDGFSVSSQFPKVLTEKQYQEKIEELIKHRMERLVDDDGFEEYLATDYHIHEIFFLSEEEKEKILKEFKPYVVDGAKDEMEDYYDEYEIEV